jgi:hypothetical protein
MNAAPSAFVRDQTQIDREHLRLLGIFHFVSAGLAFCGLLFIAGHYALFHMFFSDPKMWANASQGQGPSPAQFFGILRWFYAVMGLWFLASGVVNLLSGFYLRACRRRIFSMVVAGMNCLYMPLGTLLGVFTFIVLARDSVTKLYDAVAGQQAA